jgi:hypothetical protein
MFNTILTEEGFPLKEVRLIRHKDNRAKRGCTPYELWRDNRPQFENYQSTQSIANRPKLNAPFWAVFVVNLNEETMFAGLYGVKYQGLIKEDKPMPHMDGIDKAGSCDAWNLTLQGNLTEFIGKLFIEWGKGALAWLQHADRNNKPIIELRREFREPDFPGFMNFVEPFSKINGLPKSWVSALKSSRGVYLLTCPKTKEQYVGSAIGEDGFWGRWQTYISTGHGGNLGLKIRSPSDYQVSILEVAGTSATPDDILTMEGRWQRKLQSREM